MVVNYWRNIMRSKKSYCLILGSLVSIFCFCIYYSSKDVGNASAFDISDSGVHKGLMLSLENNSDICFENDEDKRKLSTTTETTQHNASNSHQLPTIYFVTPTYPRREQVAEITRLGQTLMHVPALHWIVADDVDLCSKVLTKLLKKFGIPFTHIASPMPEMYRKRKNVPRGVANRRAALNWIKNNVKKPGVLYFGDDDNTFDLKLFSEIRDTKRVSMFPVGLIGDYAVSSPIVKNGKVDSFFDSWPAKRKWPVDMAGFAVNLDYMLKNPKVTMPYKAGYEEDEFLKSINLKIEDIEPKANNCTEILVWHTQTNKSKAPKIKVSTSTLESENSNLGNLLQTLQSMGVTHVSESEGIKANIIKDGKAKSLSSWFR